MLNKKDVQLLHLEVSDLNAGPVENMKNMKITEHLMLITT